MENELRRMWQCSVGSTGNRIGWCELMDELFAIQVSVGSINRLRQESSDAVAQAVAKAHAYVQAQSNVNMDETSFAQGNEDGDNPNGREGWVCGKNRY
ncbi:hypothetical protein IFO70_38835 [Phormidium tenue FACHB-886]|nr:hypothetical protein [Phormidium tenue FACHB-886]